MKKCPFCGAEINEAAFVCPDCGSDLMKTVPYRVAVRPKVQEQANKISGVITILIVAAFVTLSTSCTVLFYILMWRPF